MRGLEGPVRHHTLFTETPCERDPFTVDHSKWLRRPLPISALEYAANDVYNISLLFHHFQRQGYIHPPLPAHSLKYVRLWSDAAPQPNDRYRSHPILPLEILDSPLDTAQLMCTGCHRTLACSSFATTFVPKCLVCSAIGAKLQREQVTLQTRGYSIDFDDVLWNELYGGDDGDWFEQDEWDDYPETGRDFEGIWDSD